MIRILKETVLLARLKFNQFRNYKKYTGPLVDAMGQINLAIDSTYLSKVLDDSGVTHLALFGRANGIDNNSNEHVFGISQTLKDKIIFGAVKGFDHQNDITPSFIKAIKRDINRGARFVGEIQCTHADKYNDLNNYSVTNEVNLAGERYINPLSPNFLKLMDILNGKVIPVMLHWEMYNWERDWPNFNELFTRYPDIDFIIPHAGYNSAVHAHEILRLHQSHVYFTLSKREMFYFKYKWVSFKGKDIGRYPLASYDKLNKLSSSMLEPNGKIQRLWYDVLRKYSNNFMFATDCHKEHAWSVYPEIVDHWRDILGQLPEELAEKIAFKNAMKLYKIQ